MLHFSSLVIHFLMLEIITLSIPPLIIRQISGHMGKPSLTTPLEEFLMAALMDRKQFSISILFSLQLYLKSLPDPKNKKNTKHGDSKFYSSPKYKIMRNAVNSGSITEQNQNLAFHHEKRMNHRTKETIELLLKEVFIDDNSYVDEKVARVQENSFVSNW